MNLIFLVLEAAGMKMKVFWDVAPCSYVEGDRRFRSVYLLPLSFRVIALMIQAVVRTSETSVYFNETT
jgi:hypothetical protein